MFTIMHEKDDGTQELFSAVNVQYVPPTEENGMCAGVHLLAAPGEATVGVRCGHLKVGKVFVMNDKGATVGKYYLTRPQEPPAKAA